MASKADILARMGLDTKPFDQSLRQSGRVAGKTFSGMSRAIGPVVGVAGMGALIQRSLELGDNVARLSELSGTNAEQFQMLAEGAKTVRIEEEKLGDIFKDTQDKIGDFLQTGGGPLADFFEKIAPQVGATAEEFVNLSGPEALQRYFDYLSQANLSQNEMTFYLEAIASDAAALIPLLREGGAEWKRLGEEAKEAGRIMSDSTVENLNAASDALKEAQQNVTVSSGTLVAAFIDIVENGAIVTQSILDQRNYYAELAIYEDQTAEASARLAEEDRKKAGASARAAQEQAAYNQRLKEYEAWQKASAAAALERAEAEQQAAIAFERAVEQYILDSELEALQKRAEGETELADAMDKRNEKMREAQRIAKRYNVDLAEAAQLVQDLADQEAAAESARSGSGGGGMGSTGTASRRDAESRGERTAPRGIRFERVSLGDGRYTNQRYVDGFKSGTFSDEQLEAARSGAPSPEGPAAKEKAMANAQAESEGRSEDRSWQQSIVNIDERLQKLEEGLSG